MAAQLDKFQFNVATKDINGNPLPAGSVLAYSVQVDTVNPPAKAYAVPVAEVASAVSGLVTVTFEQLGFAPVNGTTYYADVSDSLGATASGPSGVLSFTYGIVPAAPTGFVVG